uniref:Uncharacterized protein n=1 Tax=Rhodnius prolixus TaxID=13249 RepID=T1I942_RHOPR
MSAELYSTIKIIFSLLDSSLTEADEKRVGKMVYERARLELRREVLMGENKNHLQYNLNNAENT